MYNLLFGGAAGDGIETTSGLLEKILMRSGYYVFSMRDFMSRVRGGHNFSLLRYGAEPVEAHRDTLDGLVVFNEESYDLHVDKLGKDGFVLCDEKLALQNEAPDKVIRLDIEGLAKRAGNPKTIGSVCIGALLQLFGISTEIVNDVLRENLKPKIIDANIEAVRLGYEAVEARFTSSPNAEKPNVMMVTGAEAMAMGALAGGMRFYSAYPMSPSTTLLEFFTGTVKEFGLCVEQAEDEIAAVNMALGASYAGVRAMTGTSGGGFSLMVEALGFAGIAEIPIVMVDVQRPGPATGLPTRTEQSDLQFVLSASQGEFPRMVTAVRSHEDAFYKTARAFRLAEKYQMPVILLSDQYLADSGMTTPVLNGRKAAENAAPAYKQADAQEGDYLRYKLTDDGISPLRFPGQGQALVRVDSDEHDERGVITESAAVRTAMVNKRAAKLEALRAELEEPAYFGAENPHVVLVGFGSTQGALAEAVGILNEAGPHFGALCFGDVYPLPTAKLAELAGTAKALVNVEQNATGQLAKLIRQETGITCAHSILKYDGRQISVDEIVAAVQKLQH